MKFEIIDASEVVSVSRGRKSNLPQELVDALASLPVGKVIKITDLRQDPKSEDYKNAKSAVSASIRACGTKAGKKVSISWTADGIPNVRVVTKKK